jgi:hypothetical protein
VVPVRVGRPAVARRAIRLVEVRARAPVELLVVALRPVEQATPVPELELVELLVVALRPVEQATPVPELELVELLAVALRPEEQAMQVRALEELLAVALRPAEQAMQVPELALEQVRARELVPALVPALVLVGLRVALLRVEVVLRVAVVPRVAARMVVVFRRLRRIRSTT